MAENEITAQVRTEFGKGAARRSRRDGFTPSVLYGHGTDPVHLNLPSHDAFLILKDNLNALMTLNIDGKEQLALTKDIQFDPVRRSIEHVDLLVIRAGEKVSVEIPVTTVGETVPGTIHQVETQALLINVPATNIPENIEVSIDGLDDGDILRVSDIRMPPGATSEDDQDTAIVVVFTPREEPEPDEDEAAEPAEPELVGEAASDEEQPAE